METIKKPLNQVELSNSLDTFLILSKTTLISDSLDMCFILNYF